MILSRLFPVEARLFTWEWISPFDEFPDVKVVRAAFEKDFPKASERLKRNHGSFRLLHLVSFNSTEGRHLRYLVVVVESPLPNTRKRLLPKHVALLAAADRCMREQASVEDNSGNFLCYGVDGNLFYALIFFEGRLCHWIETSLVDLSAESVEKEILRLRAFLKKDSLYSRAEAFAEVRVAGTRPGDFKRASRDSLWKRVDLKKEPFECPRKKGRGLALALLIFVAACWKLDLQVLNLLEPVAEIPDALPVELDVAPTWSESMETASAQELAPKVAAGPPRCMLPRFKLKGVIASKLMMIDAEGVSSTLLLGDSLMSFKVSSIGRDGVDLVCGDSLVHRRVVDDFR